MLISTDISCAHALTLTHLSTKKLTTHQHTHTNTLYANLLRYYPTKWMMRIVCFARTRTLFVHILSMTYSRIDSCSRIQVSFAFFFLSSLLASSCSRSVSKWKKKILISYTFFRRTLWSTISANNVCSRIKQYYVINPTTTNFNTT